MESCGDGAFSGKERREKGGRGEGGSLLHIQLEVVCLGLTTGGAKKSNLPSCK